MIYFLINLMTRDCLNCLTLPIADNALEYYRRPRIRIESKTRDYFDYCLTLPIADDALEYYRRPRIVSSRRHVIT